MSSMSCWPVLPGEHRAVLRRTIGARLAQRAADLTSILEAEQAWSVPLHDAGVIEDTKHGWVIQPIAVLHRSMRRLVAFDVYDDRAVGGKLRRLVRVTVEQGETVAELAEFLRRFDSEIAACLADTAEHALVTASNLVSVLVAGNDEEAIEAAEVLAEVWPMLDIEFAPLLEGLPRIPPAELGIEQPTAESEIALLLGVPLDLSGRWYDVCTDLERNGVSLRDLGARQLGHLGAYDLGTRFQAQDYLQHALRLGRSAFPLLGHRAALLTMRLLERAATTNDAATRLLIWEFYRDEAPWIISSAEPFWEAVRLYNDQDERTKIVTAHLELAEGVLRRYGSLVIALEAIANGSTVPEPVIRPTVGSVADGLAASSDPVADLLSAFIESGLRNARAHANVTIGVSGHVLVRLEDGTTSRLIANQIYGKTMGLRSALDGVDTAVNIVFTRDVAPRLGGDEVVSPFVPEALVLMYASHAADQHTRGEVAEVEAKDGELTLTFVGEATGAELETMVGHLGVALAFHGDEPDVIRIVNEATEELASFVRKPPPPSAP